jgi:hypothetical protein
MRERNRLPATLLSIKCFGLMFVFCMSVASPAAPAAVTPVRTAKCTIDVANGKGSDCTLIKAKDEWILWSNSASKPRSVHFKSNDNPFMEKSCWDVGVDARARSGPVARTAGPKAYVAYTSDVPCDSKPPDTSRSTLKVIVQ